MNQIYPDDGLLAMLLDVVTAGGLDFHLFTNNYTPVRGSLIGNFTEAAWAGYAVVNVLPAAFLIQSVSGHVGTIIAPPISFANTSGGVVNAYGYYATRHSDGKLRFAARFDGAPAVILDGGSQQVTPILSDFSEFAA